MEDLMNELVRGALAVLVPILVTALTAAAVQLARKFGVELSAQQQAKVEHYARLAVLEAEEWAAAKIKARVTVRSGEKLTRAVATLLDRVPGLTQEEAFSIVHAALPQVGAGAAAVLGEVRRAATNEVR